MIPPCLSVEEWQSRSDIWRLHAQSLEETLDQVYAELYDTLQELEECNYDRGNDTNNGGDNINNNNDDRVKNVNNHNVEDTIRDERMATRKKRRRREHFDNNNYDHNLGEEEEDGQGGIRRMRQRDHDDVDL